MRPKSVGVFSYIRTNIWTLFTIAIVTVMFIVIGRNMIHAVSIGFEINKLEKDRAKYQYLITRDSTLLESLNHDDELERYARENFHMKHPKEEIFIIKSSER